MKRKQPLLRRDQADSVKFMQVLDKRILNKLKAIAKIRGVTVQELLRTLIIPDWLKQYHEAEAARQREQQSRDRQRRDRRRIRPH